MSLGWREAIAVAHAIAPRMTPESVTLNEALGRSLAGSVTALHDIPHFASSAMDGWAVAGPEPWTLSAPPLTVGHAWPIVTGAPIPSGTLGVLRSEWGTVRDGALHRTADARADEPGDGTHVRRAATEAARGETLIAAGTKINPAHIALAAVAGHDQLLVSRRPRVTLLLTGDEVDEAGLPDAGRVRDVFGPQLPAVLGMLGADVIAVHRVRDALDATRRAIADAAERADLVVTTGGTGRSEADHVRGALDALSATVVIPNISVRPGGPTLLAQLPDGPLVAGLPGNPLAAMVGLTLIVRACLDGMLGAASTETATVIAGADLPPGRAVMLVPYRSTDAGVVAADRVGSAMMRGLAGADGILVVPAEGVRQGERVASLPLPWSTDRAT